MFLLDIFYDAYQHLKGITGINPLRYDKGKNYCLNCGACCAYFRINFPIWEREENSGFVPLGYALPLDKDTAYMNGTAKFKGRCVSLEGNIGKCVKCSIYKNRPSVCREFEVILEDGRQNPRCMRARKFAGLKPELEVN